MDKIYTGERLETFIINETMIEHLHRYSFAAQYIKSKDVLDIASGEGYGSKLLSIDAKHVFGIDINLTAINEAKKNI
jgi:2-polyprenyl-3-methyl-5-hydroxy-6-metoxy-1,4-benzoquinol methylase